MNDDTQRLDDGTPGHDGLPGERAGDTIDRYTLLEPIGEGGMGSVWLAEQTVPVARRVALKVIKLGMDTREVVVRFEAERQALALMEHPNIAKVLDGGATANGRPFFVMELVEGEPITDFCDRNRLDLRQRLRLFVQVCDAIQHAHQKGIIHRDIKPSNVLVAARDGAHVPIVIDFGIAKATGVELTQKTMVTQHDQLIGTPEYMSPEQAGMTDDDIDTRADVYSLGALLYELLTGTKPFDVREILTSGYLELLRMIREVDPDKPSTRVASQAGSPTTATAVADFTRVRLAMKLRGDLDWIVMKSLEKERDRRYATANELANDIARYLADETVTAVPPSPLYRMRKFVRRRKKTVVAAAAFGVLLVSGSISTALGWMEASRANRDLADEIVEKEQALELAVNHAERASKAEQQAKQDEQRARDAESEAKARADELERVVRFQEGQFDDLDVKVMGARMRRSLLDAAPEERRADVVRSVAGINFTTLAMSALEQNIFDRTLSAIDEQFADQPMVQGRLLARTADTMNGLGLTQRAEGPMARALQILTEQLGPAHADTLELRDDYAFLLRDLDRYDEALAIQREIHAMRAKELGEDHMLTISSLNNIGRVLLSQGKLDEAEPLLIEALAKKREQLGEADPSTVSARNAVSQLKKMRGDYAAAEADARAVHAFYEERYGKDDTRTYTARKLIGEMLWQQRKFEAAEPHFRAAYDGTRAALGDDHPDTLAALNDLGNLMTDLQRHDEAEKLLREVVERKRRILGDRHTSTMISLNNLALLLMDIDRLDDALPLLQETREICRDLVGERHNFTLTASGNLARVLSRLGRKDQAIDLMLDNCRIGELVFGDDHPRMSLERFNVAATLRDAGRFDEAAQFFERVVAQQRGAEASQQYLLGQAIGGVGMCRVEQGRFAEAEQALRESVALEGKTSRAAIFVPILDCALATAIAGQQRFEEAEKIFVAAGEKLVAMTGKDPNDAVAQAVQRIIAFYRTWHARTPDGGYDRQAEQWQRRLADRPLQR